jgi:NTP pyrophosphatase (non-canonical NTP hydrolase)
MEKNMKKTQNKVIKFTHDRDWDQFHSPENLAKSISIEAGELLECFQWNSEFKKEEVVDELADIVNYCILLSVKLNVDLEEIVLNKLKKNEAKYPVDKSKGKSDKYTKL